MGAAACSGPESERGTDWQLVFEELDPALMSVVGSAADDVWIVGARSEGSPFVAHLDGDGWQRVAADASGDAWWAHLLGDGTVFVGGSEGMILRGDARAGLEPQNTPGSPTVYGIWGASHEELWAVGGDPDVSPGFVWRRDEEGWRDVTAEASDEPLPALFKVWGREADDVWMVGMEGVVLHYDGEAFERIDAGTMRRLFTVHGASESDGPVVAVGGFADGVILEHDGSQWADATPSSTSQLFGVHMRHAQRVYAVGMQGSVLRRDADAWEPLDTGLDVFDPLHAVWVDPGGGVWAVGGELGSPALRGGVLVHRPGESGKTIPGRIEE